ncbi:MAG: glycosyltransferase-like protein [candidate division WS6 bacterium GW2011_GWC1_33_20]|uniref:Glycosyltransferase-like protein n=1 Tax=candidate division WS6 bacterium GW2011_GWC1_33_20 TaxID=1619089 RepID=A0A0F9ZGP1_9BACT|nr:MAG: glycosyltransferase-like protein [candidate division WS6 bacterium GW2011_GWC1_33_20]KKP44966.1 MAG: glycosyltransferase-like protein [candidate division WS6 bacterium GW2011_GWF1_33_233]KKP54478.1 MAG: glycosyltransferase-like protein [candidate division WS6 bacterium GW2011_WS6_33_547]OGC36558.1 MAG: hypothetical protein A2369_03605 [candidate division WS6 bacterium RIFOXYB1_FULL_33_15]
MKKSTKLKINLFCSISKGRIEEVNKVLIPSIVKQKGVGTIILTLINYKADREINREDFVSNNTNLEIRIVNPDKPLGFGESHNLAFQKVTPEDFFFILNPDIALGEGCLVQMMNCFNKDVGIVEPTQFPFAHPKDKMKKQIIETNWASGCCLLINSKFFKEIGGFDKNFWMYLEDVDLSWKSWIQGYSVLHNPRAIVNHYTGLYFKYNSNSYEIEDFWSMRNFLYISYIYWGDSGLRKAKRILLKTEYNQQIKKEAIKSFEDLKQKVKIEHINVPKILENKIKIFGYNKFSKYPE